MNEEKKNSLTAEADGIIEGRNAVIEALRAGEQIDKIYLQKGETDKTLGHIASKARAAGVVVVEADRRKLDGMYSATAASLVRVLGFCSLTLQPRSPPAAFSRFV